MIRACFAPLRVEPDELEVTESELAAEIREILKDLGKRIRNGEVGSDEPVAIYVELLADPEERVRTMAAWMLGEGLPEDGLDEPDPRMADALYEACADESESWRVRGAAARSLTRQSDLRVADYLITLLDSPEEAFAALAAENLNTIAKKGGLSEENGKQIVARYEAEGNGPGLGRHLAPTAGLVKQGWRAKRKATKHAA